MGQLLLALLRLQLQLLGLLLPYLRLQELLRHQLLVLHLVRAKTTKERS